MTGRVQPPRPEHAPLRAEAPLGQVRQQTIERSLSRNVVILVSDPSFRQRT